MENKTSIVYCQHCGNTTVLHTEGYYEYREELATQIFGISEYHFMKCMTCNKPTLEQIEKVVKRNYDRGENDELLVNEVNDEEYYHRCLLYPINLKAPAPATDMPEEIKNDFEEARNVFGASPRASAALLRLVVQKLCKCFGQSGRNINDDIGALVEQEKISPKIQQALDIVRVIGNEAVHPGELDLRDDHDRVLSLFQIVNIIVEEVITQPKHLEEMYNNLPEEKRKAIENRDRE